VASEETNVCVLRIGLKQVGLLDFCTRDERLWRSPLLSPLSDGQKKEILECSRVRSVPSGSYVRREDDAAGEHIYFVLDGTVLLSVGGGITDLGTLGPGDFFGLESLFPQAAHVSAKADGNVRVALLPAAQVRLLMESRPLLKKLLDDTLAKRKGRADEGADFFNRW
jgi:CRP-like cAMP-binding protein